MQTFSYLYQHRNKALQRTDLYDIMPKKSCKFCHGRGLYGWRVIHPDKNNGDEVKVAVLCGCLNDEERKLKKRLEDDLRNMQKGQEVSSASSVL